MERVTRIELAFPAWEAERSTLNDKGVLMKSLVDRGFDSPLLTGLDPFGPLVVARPWPDGSEI
jgi:hypothetical protein